MTSRPFDRINDLDDHTREGIALALKGVELAVRIAFTVTNIRMLATAWKSDPHQRLRIKRMFALVFFAGMLNFTGKLFKDLKLASRSSEAPDWAKQLYRSLDIKRST